MKFNFKFSNLCGTVYKQGNVVFTPDGNSLLSPVGNRVSVFELTTNKSYTLPFENNRNISRIALAPQGHLLITVDEVGQALLINLHRQALLHHFNFKEVVHDIKFSPDGRFFAVTHGKQVQVWRAPGLNKEFTPFILHRTYTGQHDAVVFIDWSPDSKFFVTASHDLTCRLFSLESIEGFTPITLAGHRDYVMACFFSEDMQNIYTISKDGALYIWERHPNANPEIKVDNEEQVKRHGGSTLEIAASTWRIGNKHYFNQNHARVISASFHKQSRVLTVGFSSGIFALYELPEFNNIHSLSVSQHRISAVAVSPSGEWLALGSSKLGQLLVWEWQSETYILKQQGHFYDVSAIAYSPTGLYIASGGDDGKIKVWNTHSGFCFVTFTEHQGGITGVTFSSHGHSIFTSSLDGTVRAYDLVRYRNFRTFTAPKPVQLACLALDKSAEIVCAGSLDTFEIFVWSVQTSHLLVVLAGHEGPISSLNFGSQRSVLVSGSWDKTVRLWDVYSSGATPEVYQLQSDVLAVALRPDDKELCVSTLDGQLTFWDMINGNQIRSIEGRRDLASGRKDNDSRSSKNSTGGKAFNSICYSADGENLLAGGNSRFVCIYNVPQTILLRRFQVSKNKSLDGMVDTISSRRVTEAGLIDNIDDSDEEADVEGLGKARRKEEGGAGGMDTSLPGVTKGDMSSRKTKPEIRTRAVQFSPTGRSWAAASTEGLLVYSLDEALVFDPIDLDIDVTPDAVHQLLSKREFARALALAFRLGERALLVETIEAVDVESIPIVARQLTLANAERMIAFIAGVSLDKSRHIQYYLKWINSILNHHAARLKTFSTSAKSMQVYRALQKELVRHFDDLSKICEENRFSLEYLDSLSLLSAGAPQSMDL